MTSGLWHRGTSPSLLYKSCRKWSGNEILSKGHGRAHRSHTFDSLLRAPPSPPSPTLDYWTKCKSVYINTTKKSSWIPRLIETAWVMLLCLIACAFQNGFGIFKTFIRNGPWPVMSPEFYLAHEHVQNRRGRMMGHECTARGSPKLIWVWLQSIHLLCT